VLLCLWSPLPDSSLAGQERGRTIPLSRHEPADVTCEQWCGMALNNSDTRETAGAASFSSANHLPPTELSKTEKPVTLPPGLPRLHKARKKRVGHQHKNNGQADDAQKENKRLPRRTRTPMHTPMLLGSGTGSMRSSESISFPGRPQAAYTEAR